MTLPEPPQPNLPLLRKAVEWAEAEAAKTDGTCEWNQQSYAQATDCGTAYCIAGYVVSIQPGYSETRTVRDAECDCPACAGYTRTGVVPYINGVAVDFCEKATAALGITGREAIDLFFGNNTIEDVRAEAEGIAKRAGERL